MYDQEELWGHICSIDSDASVPTGLLLIIPLATSKNKCPFIFFCTRVINMAHLLPSLGFNIHEYKYSWKYWVFKGHKANTINCFWTVY